MKKVLIISTNAIGDAYLSMSAISPLEKEYGNVDFTFVFPKSTRKLDFSKDTDYKILYASKSIANFVLIIAKLFFQKFDFAFSFFPGRYNTFLLKLCSSQNKAGYYNYKKIERWDDKILSPTICRHGEIELAPKWNDSENYLELINNILRYFVTESIIKKYKPFFVEKVSSKSDTVIIHGLSRISEKSLTTSQFKIIINFLSASGIEKICILGTEKDNERIKNKLSCKNVSYLSNLSLEKLVVILNRSFLIGIDSFPLHVADAYNTRFIGLFSCTKTTAVLTNVNKSINFNNDSFSKVSSQEFEEKLPEIKLHFKNQGFISKF